MDKTILLLDRNTLKKERPYFIIPDNVKSTYTIDLAGTFASINAILESSSLKKVLNDSTYYRTDYLNKQVLKYKND